MNKENAIKLLIKQIKGDLAMLEMIIDNIGHESQPDTATGQQTAKDDKLMPCCHLCGKSIDNSGHLSFDNYSKEYVHSHCVNMKILNDSLKKSICKICGNTKKPTTKIKDGYYCSGCQNDLMPDDAKTGEAVKRKFCFSCGSRLHGFYKVDDTEELICEKCDAINGRR